MASAWISGKTRWPAVVMAAALAVGAVGAVSAAAWAEDGTGGAGGAGGAGSAASAAGDSSFGSAFFISRRMVPGSGELQLELLGSAIIWSLLLLSMVSIGMIGFMAMTNQRRTIMPAAVVLETRRLIESGEYQAAAQMLARDESFFGRVMTAALGEAPYGYTAMVRHLQEMADELVVDRFRRLEFLNVLGQVSPMIGLFGTVYGMILAFHAIKSAGGNADPVMLAGGIGTALTTTFWGLVVAIPARAGYAVVRNRVDTLTTEAVVTGTEMLRVFRPKAAKPS